MYTFLAPAVYCRINMYNSLTLVNFIVDIDKTSNKIEYLYYKCKKKINKCTMVFHLMNSISFVIIETAIVWVRSNEM